MIVPISIKDCSEPANFYHIDSINCPVAVIDAKSLQFDLDLRIMVFFEQKTNLNLRNFNRKIILEFSVSF